MSHQEREKERRTRNVPSQWWLSSIKFSIHCVPDCSWLMRISWCWLLFILICKHGISHDRVVYPQFWSNSFPNIGALSKHFLPPDSHRNWLLLLVRNGERLSLEVCILGECRVLKRIYRSGHTLRSNDKADEDTRFIMISIIYAKG